MRSRILCISGQPENFARLSAMLHSLPLVLDHVGTVQQARTQLQSEEYDAVLTEGTLPDGNWLDVLHLIRASPHELGVIVTDAKADARFWAEALNLGAHDVLPQPFEEQEVRRILHSACSRSRAFTTAL